MKPASHLLALFVGAALVAGPSIAYFTNVRDVRISQSEQQNDFVVNEEIWALGASRSGRLANL